MKGFIKPTFALACLGTGMALLAGCKLYDHCVDPCYPQRYEWEARQPVYEAFGAQASNGHVLDQTIWNFYFEPGTDALTLAGQNHLAYLARRRPEPDPKVWVATAYDLRYDGAAPEKFVQARAELDTKRVQAVEKYLTANTAARPTVFEVLVHDPAMPSIAGPAGALMMQRHYANFQGMMYSQPQTGTGLGSTGGAGSVSGGGGAGGMGGR